MPDETPAEKRNRPPLDMDLTGSEFRRWYWTLAELRHFARSQDISGSGAKADVTDRIAAHMDDAAAPTPTRPKRVKDGLGDGPFHSNVVIPPNQASTTALRSYFIKQIGSTFKFDGHMRSFLKNSTSATLDDAVAHWHATRGTELPNQSPSLEFNRFTKEWHREFPNGPAEECRAAWNRYRSLPVDQRPAVRDA